VPERPPNPSNCEARSVLDLIGDKWSLYVVAFLGDGPRRFTELKRGVEGISQRMLTVTLRGLERDGVLTRTVHEVMPPHVSYQLTPMGRSLLRVSGLLIEWSEQHLPKINAARAAYDERESSRSAG
jgi:DNA-binding HxlR family transcriptional regulator